MKVLHLASLLLLISTTHSKILDDNSFQNQNALVQVETTTIPDTKEKTEPQIVPTNITKSDHPCFHADIQEFCFNKTGSKPSCDCEIHPENQFALVCCNVTDIMKSIGCAATNLSSFTDIHIINLETKDLNVAQINPLKHFNSLIITDGNITKISGVFPKFSSFKCLNFSNNNITEINERAISLLPQLQFLDLSSNNLTKLPSPSTKTKVDVRRNLKMSCKQITAAMSREIEFLYKNSSLCEAETTYNWFNETVSITIENLEHADKLEIDCPARCRCRADWSYNEIHGGDLIRDSIGVFAVVDCSNAGLTTLPDVLPMDIKLLNITNNSISSLSPLVDNEYYQNIIVLYADDNQIKSIVELEGKFLENFFKISLRNNKIKEIPFYILSFLEKKMSGKTIFLGGNRIHCDCQTFKNIRIWRLIQDFDKILCDNMPARVMELKESQLCKSGYHDWASYIDFIIVIEVILLVMIITKVSYDWYVFKKSGFLPYPASWIILYNQK